MQPLDWVMYLYLIYSGIYVLIFVLFKVYWQKTTTVERTSSRLPNVSLLIPVRNEELQLPGLFESLHALNYANLEVIFTNDFSEDNSVALLERAVEEAQAVGKNWRLIHSTQTGKKSAQTTAVLAASGELIVSTDADCRFEADWINQLVAQFDNPAVLLVAGPVMTLPMKSMVFSAFQQIEWSSILLVTQLAFGMGKPFMCSGANMAYHKATFLALKGYDGNTHLLSGDDEFLLKKILRTYGPSAVRYLPKAEVLVKTAPQENWASLFKQRARWASKWTEHKSLGHVVIALVPFVMQLLFIVSPILFLAGWPGVVLFCSFWGIKIGIERWVVASLLADFKLHLPFWTYITTSFMHPIYALITAIKVVNSDWEWKGRKQ